jgi:hypothetical protein
VEEHERFADWDAGYVLGALSAAERRNFEDHLDRCADCRNAVAELAGMPGLLAQVPQADALALIDDHTDGNPATATELPESIRTMSAPVRSGPTRPISTLIVVVAVAALLLGGALGFLLHDSIGPAPDPSPAPSPSAAAPSALRLAFVPVQPTTMIAIADVTPDGSGTTIGIECQYPSGGYPTGGYPTGGYPGGSPTTGGSGVGYVLYVVDDSGTRTRGASWTAAPGERVTRLARIPTPMAEIRALEIAAADTGDVVVRAQL